EHRPGTPAEGDDMLPRGHGYAVEKAVRLVELCGSAIDGGAPPGIEGLADNHHAGAPRGGVNGKRAPAPYHRADGPGTVAVCERRGCTADKGHPPEFLGRMQELGPCFPFTSRAGHLIHSPGARERVRRSVQF